MPGISSTAPRYENWDMDHLDHYQHYFYDDHDPDEDFFKSTAPSEDIWKKFELVPTPPMSPIRAVEGSGRVGLLYPSLGDKLEWVSQFLGQEDEQQHQQDVPCKLATTGDSFGNLSSIIIQDCMWSGFSAGQQLERVVGERYSACPGTGVAAKVAAGSAITSPGRVQSGPGDTVALGGLAADCVDPAAVLTFPITGGCKKQVSSGSESQSDSSDDDDDKDEDEEEIDVVTVEHKQQRKPRRLVNTRKPVTITVRADPFDPGMKRFHISIHQQQHNYAAPSPDTLPTAPEPPRKRVRQENASAQATPPPPQNSSSHQPRPGHAPLNVDSRKPHVTVARSESPNLSASSPTSSASPSSPSSSSSHPQRSPSKPPSFLHLSSPQSSDCEDTDKRKAHNFLERKRRNDLRSRFLSLRDEIPGLADCPKTPKVAILTRATEYLQQLHASDRQKAQERKQLKARQLQLLQRLAQLKRS
ncbi:protein L-Myc-1b [Neolamprologus brichardi]|uniref:MYCL proto-oncogene, bHLH transcription factor b n=1 Tax=Neolamprologus brichardi TaxID=32507 RepID=A0A3Q4I8L3_NEOBR|nr:protein L-Myc-1b [Neolamprologus brichardi]XP_006795267.1 protein L-Myc-1b [Neolamprologus brichardi]